MQPFVFALRGRWPAIAIILLALGFVVWSDARRVRRLEFVTWSTGEGATADSLSPTGWADGKRWLVVPEHNNRTFQFIEETQLMLSRHVWRLRAIDYENAPGGREVHSASLERWWLAALGGAMHRVTGKPLGMEVERAALFAGPLLHVLVIAGTAIVAWCALGAGAAAMLAAALAAIFPFGSAFLPGIATDFSADLSLDFAAFLLLAIGVRRPAWARPCFFAAGLAGGAVLWISVAGALPMIGGMVFGAALAAVLAPDPVPPWRWWGLGGAIASILAYAAEYFPRHLRWELSVNHPLYGLAWLAIAELMAQGAAAACAARCIARPSRTIRAVLSALVLAVVVALWLRLHDRAFLSADLLATRLSDLPGAPSATSLLAWLKRDGPTLALAAAVAPVLLLLPGVAVAIRAPRGDAVRASAALALGPALLLMVWSCHQLRAAGRFDAAALALAVAATTRPWRWAAGSIIAVCAALGVAEAWPPPTRGGADFAFTRSEVECLYERSLAHWIADHAGPEGGTVLVAPLRTSSFCFYGGLRGLGTPDWDNRDGLAATYRVAASIRPDETQALLNQFGVTHIVLPSWDEDLDQMARLGVTDPSASFIYALHHTYGGIFSFLRPLPYGLPELPGFGDPSVLLLAVGDSVNPALLHSRLVEYLIEIHRPDQAARVGRTLLKYPADLGSRVALAELAHARSDPQDFDRLIRTVVANLQLGTDRRLPWDRRVSLAVVLALGGRADLCRPQLEKCVASADAARLRGLTTGSLYHLMVLMKHFDLHFTPPQLQPLALKLLPEELSGRL